MNQPRFTPVMTDAEALCYLKMASSSFYRLAGRYGIKRSVTGNWLKKDIRWLAYQLKTKTRK